MKAVHIVFIFLIPSLFVHGQVFIFELPELIVKINTTYLSKHDATRLRCEIFDNVANLTFREVYWIKDSLPVNELPSRKGSNELLLDGNELIIVRGSHRAEGEYQCATVIVDIPLTENTTINTRLISAPVRLRRAKITKFENFRTQTIRVTQGQVARLPCLGMPDSIPPAQVWMEREGNEGLQLGMTSNLRFVSTPTGVQIAIAQPSDAGKYYCVVKNTYTNQTRKAPLPITLAVDSKYDMIREKKNPQIVYPAQADYSKPIIVHAVVGQKVVLECVIWYARVVWNTADYSLPPVSLTDETARVRQIWGNLRFKNVEMTDSGLFECHGLDRFNEDMQLQEPKHPRVRYLLKVHAPTSVKLMVTQSLFSKHLQMSCMVNNSGYEIPMVYVNGDPLIDAMEKLGIPPQPSFFSNPVNVTLATHKPLTGSIQCISKPAMDEAEVYGDGLERGRTSNLYVTDRSSSIEKLIEQGPKNVTKTVGSDAQFTCVPASSDVKMTWLKNNQKIDVGKNPRMTIVGSATLLISNVQPEDQGWYTCVGRDSSGRSTSKVSAFLETINNTVPSIFDGIGITFDAPSNSAGPLTILKPRAFVASGQNVRLQWGLPSNHPQLVNLIGFEIEMQNADEPDEQWLQADIRVQPHVRAVTVRSLIPQNRYKFRIVGELLDGRKIFSPSTEWMEIPRSFELLPQPVIKDVFPVAFNSFRISWSYVNDMQISDEDKFHVNYQAINNSVIDKDSIIVTGSSSVILQDLEPETEYAVSVYAENNGAQSPVSKIKFIRTHAENWKHEFDIEDDQMDVPIWQNWFPSTNQMQFVAIVVLTAIVVVFIICASCIGLWWARKRCFADKGQRKRNGKQFFLVQGTKNQKASFSLGQKKLSESAELSFTAKDEADNCALYANQSPESERFAGSRLEIGTSPSNRPRIISNDLFFEDINPSRISLDTVVGMRAERSHTYNASTLNAAKDPIHNYVNIGSNDANLYSTFRRGHRTRRLTDQSYSPFTNRKNDTETSALLPGGYSPESSTVSPISHSSLVESQSSKNCANLPTFSTFRPPVLKTAINTSTFTLNKRPMNESVIDTSCDGDNFLPQAVVGGVIWRQSTQCLKHENWEKRASMISLRCNR
uniref:Uncharacterized protein n=1 Tax=Panagrolaimus sp. JU765 TaxID=591449 RepID=A0AC34RJR5_9BILA